MVERTSLFERGPHVAPGTEDDDRPLARGDAPPAEGLSPPAEDGGRRRSDVLPAGAAGRGRARTIPRVAVACVLIVLVSTVAAGAVALTRPDRYGAHVDLLIDVPATVDSNQAAQLLSTQVVVVTGPSVLAP